MDTTDGPGERQLDDVGSQQVDKVDFRQGDIVPVTKLPLVGSDGSIEQFETPLGAVLISQTCDLVQPDRPTAQLAALKRLPSTQAKEAIRGRRPRFVNVPELGDDVFADLEVIATVSKEYLAELGSRPGLPAGGNHDSRFGRAIGRRFSRFPFPDELHPWIVPLQDVVQRKANKLTSPLGRVLDSVDALRLECTGDWHAGPPYDLTLLVILPRGVLPEVGENAPAVPGDLARWALGADGTVRRNPAEIADKIESANSNAERFYLWQYLGESLIAKCRAAGEANPQFSDAVRSLEAEVIGEDELSYDRAIRSEELDLDHLSPPAPK